MKKNIKLWSQVTMCLLLGASAFRLNGQVITKLTNSSVSGTVCPVSSTDYKVTTPSNFGTCQINWTIINGQITSQNGQNIVTVVWNDTPGALGKITVTFAGCGGGNPNEGLGSSKEELILSVNNKDWDSYGNLFSIDFCTTSQLYVTVPRMFVDGTGGLTGIQLQEVGYSWTLPPGWKVQGSGITGSTITTTNYIMIIPDKCAVPGTVTVKGAILDRCGVAGLSHAATININGVSPIVTIGPQGGYTGTTACNYTPVTFTASLTPALGCASSYTWNYPSGMTLIGSTFNTITLRPSGTLSDRGPINATAHFSCNSLVPSGDYNNTYTRPFISGTKLVCSSAIYSIQNAQGLAINWSTSNTNILTMNSSGVASRVGSANGQVTVSATLPCLVRVDTIVWVGPPYFSSVTYDGALTNSACDGAQTFTTGLHVLNAIFPKDPPVNSATGYPTFTLGGPSTVHGSAAGNDFTFDVKRNDILFQIEYSITNTCGTAYGCTYFSNSGGPEIVTPGDDELLSVYPNPAQNQITIIQKTDQISVTAGEDSFSAQLLIRRAVFPNQEKALTENSSWIPATSPKACTTSMSLPAVKSSGSRC